MQSPVQEQDQLAAHCHDQNLAFSAPTPEGRLAFRAQPNRMNRPPLTAATACPDRLPRFCPTFARVQLAHMPTSVVIRSSAAAGGGGGSSGARVHDGVRVRVLTMAAVLPSPSSSFANIALVLDAAITVQFLAMRSVRWRPPTRVIAYENGEGNPAAAAVASPRPKKRATYRLP